MPDAPATGKKYDVGGVLLDRPFKVRRLGHFGFDAIKMEECRRFYNELLGFRLSDVLDFKRVARDPKQVEGLGETRGYFLRYGTDHHASLFPFRVQILGVMIGAVVQEIAARFAQSLDLLRVARAAFKVEHIG